MEARGREEWRWKAAGDSTPLGANLHLAHHNISYITTRCLGGFAISCLYSGKQEPGSNISISLFCFPPPPPRRRADEREGLGGITMFGKGGRRTANCVFTISFCLFFFCCLFQHGDLPESSSSQGTGGITLGANLSIVGWIEGNHYSHTCRPFFPSFPSPSCLIQWWCPLPVLALPHGMHHGVAYPRQARVRSTIIHTCRSSLRSSTPPLNEARSPREPSQ